MASNWISCSNTGKDPDAAGDQSSTQVARRHAKYLMLAKKHFTSETRCCLLSQMKFHGKHRVSATFPGTSSCGASLPDLVENGTASMRSSGKNKAAPKGGLQK
jgi:hypothetical protein